MVGRMLAVWVVSFVTWCLLVAPYDAATRTWDGQALLAGVGAALLVALVFRNSLSRHPIKLLQPLRYVWLLLYIPTFVYYCICANLQMVYLVLHPDMPIRPGIVKIHTNLKTDSARTALANSITLTPGTFTVDITDDGDLYIHWIQVETQDSAEASRLIAGKFEPFLTKIFE